jgi:hypothetical protein
MERNRPTPDFVENVKKSKKSTHPTVQYSTVQAAAIKKTFLFPAVENTFLSHPNY